MECEHIWSNRSPYRILFCVTYEEPQFYPPSGNLPVQFCTKCGVLRLTGGIGSETDNLSEAIRLQYKPEEAKP